MRKTLAALVFFFVSGSLFAIPCSDPYIMVSGIAGELSSPCQGGIDFIAARVAGNTLNVTKRLDKASPLLYLACATGKHIQRLTINLPNQRYEFSDLLASSVTHAATPANEVVVFNFSGFQSDTGSTRARELNVMGTARAGGAAVAFVNGPGGGSAPTASLQLQPKPGTATTQAAAMRPPGTLLVRYVFQGVVPPQGGNLKIEKMQVQIPPGPTCNWMGQPGGWAAHNDGVRASVRWFFLL